MTDTAKKLAKIYAPLDPGIKDAVELLRNADINTVASCDGRHDGKKELPWIAVDIPNESWFYGTQTTIVNRLIHAGYHGFTVQNESLYQGGFNPWKVQIRVTFWAEAKPA